MRDSKEIMRNPLLTVEAGGSKFGFGVIQIPNCLHLWRDKAGQIDEVLKGRMMK